MLTKSLQGSYNVVMRWFDCGAIISVFSCPSIINLYKRKKQNWTNYYSVPHCVQSAAVRNYLSLKRYYKTQRFHTKFPFSAVIDNADIQSESNRNIRKYKYKLKF